ncbi:H(+) Cl(-) exchange transporter 7 [Brachionus plicatilis]|uniref:H(+) Cl(-) exchange transporter 7 n=1 Tax=Brachionus plicatilis TaxID=10195 RepID=A0A3M7PMV5_BRAPC|nr:H(+) Cl(-) exchange transporter 7 [Brachionus plicatilis]
MSDKELKVKKVVFFENQSLDEDEDTNLLQNNKNFTYSSINADSSGEFIIQNLFENSACYLEAMKQNDHEFLSNNYEATFLIFLFENNSKKTFNQSLDYDKIYNMIDMNKEPKSANSIFVKNLSRWIVMFLVGICTGLVGVTIDYLVEIFSKIKYSFIAKSITDCTPEGCLWKPLVLWIGSNIGFSLMSVLLVVYLAPASRGSGIPTVKCYLNGVKIPKVIRIKTLISKVLGIAAAVTGGLACGKEGPMIHSGAIIAAGISQGASTSLGFDLNLISYPYNSVSLNF